MVIVGDSMIIGFKTQRFEDGMDGMVMIILVGRYLVVESLILHDDIFMRFIL